MPDIVTVGWLTIDDIVLPDGTYQRGVVGGGALYSAVGARLWNDDVGVHSVTGEAVFADVIARIRDAGLDAGGINAIPGRGLELWLLHENERDKQQVPKLASASAAEMDRGRAPLPDAFRSARGFHIAPQTPGGSFANLASLSRLPQRPIVTLDLLADAYVDAKQYADTGFLDGLTAFLPSREEVERLWRPADLAGWVRALADRHACALAVKLGGDGSLVCGGRGRPIHHVPAYPAEVVDTTGAGDGYCGGFVAGLVAGRPIVECAAMATVSASYVVEAHGALATRRPTREARAARLEQVGRRVETHA